MAETDSGPQASRRGRRTTSVTAGRLLHLRGVPWTRIGEFVGASSLSVTDDTYTHVLTDERENDYAAPLKS